MNGVASKLVLRNDERIVQQKDCRHVIIINKVLAKGLDSTARVQASGGKGFLILTTHRIFFIKAHGTFNVSLRLEFEIPLENIIGVSTTSDSIFLTERYGLEHRFKLGNVQELKAEIDEMIRQRAKQYRKPEIGIDMDFGKLDRLVKERGISVSSLECPYCGGPVALPKEGIVATCGHCKREVVILSVLDEIKKLLYGS